LPLSQPVAACLSVCTNLPLQFLVSANSFLWLTCCLLQQVLSVMAFQSHVIETAACRDQVRQRPNSSETHYIRNSPTETGSAWHHVGEILISEF
jgi:hypothetical protein